MTGDTAHPEAQCPVLRCPPDCRYYWPPRFDLETALIEFTVQVYHDHVACLYQLSAFGGKDMVVVWNWRSGQVVKVNSPLNPHLLSISETVFYFRSSVHPYPIKDNTPTCHF
jgi:hypothetical protein